MTFYVEECNGQFQWDASHHNGNFHTNKEKWRLVDKVEEGPKMDSEEMERLSRELFPSEFLSRNILNFEDHCTLYGFGPEPTKNRVQNMIKFNMFDHP